MANISQFKQTLADGALTRDTVLTLVPRCTVRHQEDQFLVYNPDTDELHLLPHTAYYAMRMCDGMATVSATAKRLGHAWSLSLEEAEEQLMPLFAGLVERGILEARNDLQ